MKNKIIAALSAFLLIAAFTGCSAGVSQNSTRMDAAYPEYGMASSMAPAAANIESVMNDVAYEEDMEYTDAETVIGSGEITANLVNALNRKVIRTFNLTMQTLEFENSIKMIETTTSEYNGFMENSNIQGRSMFDKYNTRRADFTLRIPSEKLDTFVAFMEENFNITYKHQSGDDITDRFFDTEARLKTLKIQEERLLKMLEQSGELEHLLQVERELSNVRYEIESFTSTLLRMQNQVSLSTVYLSIEEVVEYTPIESVPVTFAEEIEQTFRDSGRALVSFMKGSVLAIIWMLPLIFITAAVVIVIFAVTRKKRKAKKLAKKELAARKEITEQARENGTDDGKKE